MSDLNYILGRIEQGARVRLMVGYYGQSAIEVPAGWLPLRRRFKLTDSELDCVRNALRSRRARRSEAGAHHLQRA